MISVSASNAVGREFAHQPYQRPSLKWYNLPPRSAYRHLGGGLALQPACVNWSMGGLNWTILCNFIESDRVL